MGLVPTLFSNVVFVGVALLIVFDKATAQRFEFPFPCSHELYRDAHGNFVLYCQSYHTGGGVTVNEAALEFLLGLPGEMEAKQVYLKSKDGWTWEGKVESLPYKDSFEGNGRYPGAIRIYDKADLYPNQVPFSAVTPMKAQLPVVSSAQDVPGEREISFEELKTRTNATFTNPALSTLVAHTQRYPVNVVIEGGAARFIWKA